MHWSLHITETTIKIGLLGSEDEKQSQQVCFSVLKYIYMKIVTMIDGYKKRIGYLCCFEFVS